MAHDRVALITGGTRGIGAAICRELAGQGAHVAAGQGIAAVFERL
jgi:NAD(P)-dependent dehydrogenase (short-subunit alcohol dehydrogenase family)